MFIQMFFLRSIVQLKGESSISRAISTLYLKIYKDKKNVESSLGKNSYNYEGVQDETSVYEQKPIEIDGFYETEEKIVEEKVEKRKNKRRGVAESDKFLKNKKKQEYNKEKEK